MKNKSIVVALATILFAHQAYTQQFFNYLKPTLGWAYQPEDTATVDPPEYYGSINDMSGGYAIGDTVHEFTVYDFDGNPLVLSEELKGQRPVVLINGSVSCLRFRSTFDTLSASQEYAITQAYMFEHQDDFNWIFIYNMEAHPSEGYCPSNCPNVPNLDTAVVQHPNYVSRRYAMHDWLESDSSFYFPWPMYCDNPDNHLYNYYFRRPFGILLLDCAGVVTHRGDWTNQWIAANTDELDELLLYDFQQCQMPVSVNSESSDQDPIAYPLPFKQELSLNNLDAGDLIRIMDSAGKLIFETRTSAAAIQLATDDWNSGLYIIQIFGNHSVQYLKAAKE